MGGTQQTLAQLIRSKYPGAYQDLSDTQLEQSVLAKHPEYSDLPRTATGANTTRSDNPNVPITTPQPGESFEDTMNRAVTQGKQTTPAQIAESEKGAGGKAATVLGVAPVAGPALLTAGAIAPEAASTAVGGGIPGAVAAGATGGAAGTALVEPATGTNPFSKAGATEIAKQGAIGGATGGVLAGGGKLASMAIDAIPSASHAGNLFQDLSKTIGSHPVNITDDLGKSLTDLRQASTTTNTGIPPVVRKLIDRVDPFQGGAPLTYDEARAFSVEINHLSASDNLSMTPNTKRLVNNLNQTLKASVQDTADVAGKGQQLSSAMKEYSRAMTVKGWGEDIKANAWKALLSGVGGAVGYQGIKKAIESIAP